MTTGVVTVTVFGSGSTVDSLRISPSLVGSKLVVMATGTQNEVKVQLTHNVVFPSAGDPNLDLSTHQSILTLYQNLAIRFVVADKEPPVTGNLGDQHSRRRPDKMGVGRVRVKESRQLSAPSLHLQGVWPKNT
jgi:hypothetical protein